MKLKTTPHPHPSLSTGLPTKEEVRDASLEPSDNASQSPELASRIGGPGGLHHKSPGEMGGMDKRGGLGHAHTPQATSPVSGAVPSPTQCQFAGVGASSFSQSCALSGGGVDSQVYYPHHPGVGRVASGFLPVSSSSGMGGGSLLPSSISSLHSAASCRVPGVQPGSSSALQDCSSSLRQPSALAPASYGGLRNGGGQASHPSLSSCTYMQSSQHYPGLNSSMHMMNVNFAAGHMP